jgi:hypothetical protein
MRYARNKWLASKEAITMKLKLLREEGHLTSLNASEEERASAAQLRPQYVKGAILKPPTLRGYFIEFRPDEHGEMQPMQIKKPQVRAYLPNFSDVPRKPVPVSAREASLVRDVYD